MFRIRLKRNGEDSGSKEIPLICKDSSLELTTFSCSCSFLAQRRLMT